MQLIQLKYFKAIVKYGTMNKAAEKLYVSQSAISQSILRLEQEMGVRFFDRPAGGKICLNENGRKLLFYIDKILNIEAEMQALFQKNYFKTNICLYSGGGRLFSPLISNYAKKHPDISFSTYVTSRSEGIRALLDGKADILIDCGYIDEPEKMHNPTLDKYITDEERMEKFCKEHGLQYIFFYRSNVYLCVPISSAYESYNSITLEQLESIPVIRREESLDYEHWLSELATYKNIKLNTLMTVDNDTYENMIFYQGYNAIIMSSFIMHDMRFRTHCKLIPIDEPMAMRDFYLFARKDKEEVNQFIHEALAEFDWSNFLYEHNARRNE